MSEDQLLSKVAELEAKIEEKNNRIDYLESVIDDIAGALCDYCNQVGDRFDPPSQWDDYCKRSFENLCKVYNDWYKKHKEIGTISSRWFSKEQEVRKQTALRISSYLDHIRIDEDAKKLVRKMIEERGHW